MDLPEQRGLLPGSPLPANVVHTDEATMTAALLHNNGAARFFDFQAAFPSVCHDFILEVLSHIGIPPGIMAFVQALYQGNRCSIVLGGTEARRL